jgi:hypothetical protein
LPLPPSDPVAKRDWNEFSSLRDRALALMPLKLTQPDAVLAKNSASAAQPGSTP